MLTLLWRYDIHYLCTKSSLASDAEGESHTEHSRTAFPFGIAPEEIVFGDDSSKPSQRVLKTDTGIDSACSRRRLQRVAKHAVPGQFTKPPAVAFAGGKKDSRSGDGESAALLLIASPTLSVKPEDYCWNHHAFIPEPKAERDTRQRLPLRLPCPDEVPPAEGEPEEQAWYWRGEAFGRKGPGGKEADLQ